MSGQPISILLFADGVLGIHPYDWQCKILLNYEAGFSDRGRVRQFHRKDFNRLPDRCPLDPLQFPACSPYVYFGHRAPGEAAVL
jgi:hypothetical protein